MNIFRRRNKKIKITGKNKIDVFLQHGFNFYLDLQSKGKNDLAKRVLEITSKQALFFMDLEKEIEKKQKEIICPICEQMTTNQTDIISIITNGSCYLCFSKGQNNGKEIN